MSTIIWSGTLAPLLNLIVWWVITALRRLCEVHADNEFTLLKTASKKTKAWGDVTMFIKYRVDNYSAATISLP
jgi:hypothetical protein